MRLRDRFVRHFQGAGDGPPFLPVFGPMRETARRWAEQGMVEPHGWFNDVGFDGEPGKQFGVGLPVNAFVCPEFEPEVFDEDDRFITRRNSWGTIVKVHKNGRHMDYPVDFPVRDERTWGAMKERLLPESGERFPADWQARKRAIERAESPSRVGGLPCGFFGAPRELFGVERWLTCFYDNPGLAHDVLDTLCDLWSRLFGDIARQTRVDLLFIWEDMCYRGGPLVSPAIFRRFMLPRYQRLTSAAREAGIPVVLVDTDGNFEKLLPLFIEGGVDIMFPFEVQSGMDVVATRRDYPDLGIIGGIEKTMPSQSHSAIQDELGGIRALMATGRYLPCSDHGVPPTVTYDEYVTFYRQLGAVVRGSQSKSPPTLGVRRPTSSGQFGPS